MLYQLVLIDLDNYLQNFESEDIQIINKIFEKTLDSYTITYKHFDFPIMVVQKMIRKKTERKLENTQYINSYNYIINNNTHYRFSIHKELIKNNEEIQYLKIMNDLIHIGDYRITRNGFTYSLFGKSLSFDISNSFPLLTTKKVFFRGIIEELLFFLRGETNSKILEAKGVNIWKPNTTNEFIKSRNLPYKEGDMGPMYGFNWLHFGAEYKDCNTDYSNQGINQIEKVIKLLKEDPFSRRIIMTTYNPYVAEDGVLYPCHGIVVQFYVNQKEDKYYLSCNMTQRSADIACGVPYNIASYAALVYLLCKHLGDKYLPDKLIINLGDVHLYEEHLNEAIIQIARKPKKFPKLEIKQFEKIEDLKYEDFILTEYEYDEPLKYIMKA
jgi:thymidylate synthase